MVTTFKRGIRVVSGSTVVHQFLDTPGTADATLEKSVTFNRTSGPGKFNISGSAAFGRGDQNFLSDGTRMFGLMRVPYWDSTADATQIEALVGSGLAAGNFNGSMFYMSSKDGYTGGNALAASVFARGQCYYWCKNSRWYQGYYSPIADSGDPNEGFTARTVTDMMETFDGVGNWGRNVSIANLDSFSNFSSPNDSDSLLPTAVSMDSFSGWANPSDITNTFSETFEHGQGFHGTGTVNSQGVPTGTDFDSPDHTFSETTEHGQGFFGTATVDSSGDPTGVDFDSPDHTFSETTEHGQGFFGTATVNSQGTPTGHDFSSPDNSFVDDMESWQILGGIRCV